ncbi:MAG: hypothetical protein KDA78_17020, partial [Planctomycetaceae bacterium]|nr:hypothetical protein [Planctomycetaceae bacterium]
THAPKHTVRACGLLVAMCAIVFGQSIQFDFVNWDDPWYVLNNELIHSWSFSNLLGICTETVTRNFAPLTIFSYLLDYTCWGEWAGGYHLTNLILHAVNAVLVFLLVRQVTQRHVFSLLVAILFAIHPVQVESVVWISARKGLLCSTFTLGSLLYWLKRERTSTDELCGTGLFVIALLCKASAVVLPGIVLLYDWQVRNRSLFDALARQFVGGLIAVWFILLTAGSQNSQTGGIRHHLELSKLELIGIDTVLLWKYIAMLIWPENLAILYDPPVSGIGLLIALSTCGWLAVIIIAWRIRVQNPFPLFALGSALMLMVPVLNLFPLTTLMNDRYLYLPCIGLFAVLLGLVERITKTIWNSLPANRPIPFAWVGVSAGILVVWFSSLTMSQLRHWENDQALWAQAAQVSPELPLVQYQYGIALWNRGEHQAAIERITQALSLPRVDELDRERFSEKLHLYQQHSLENLQVDATVE